MRFVSRNWMAALLLIGVWALGGCSEKKEVTGQVFVVTKGGENVKLGLVGIHVIGEKELAGIARQIQRQAATHRANRDLLEGLEKEIQDLVGKAPPKFTSSLQEIERSVSGRRLSESMKDSPEVELFRMLPQVATQTDADGLFVVQAAETDWLAARGQRRAGDSTENYLWVMPLAGGQKKLLVSNDRLLDDEYKLLRALGQVSPVEAGIGAESSLAAWAAEQRTAGQVALAEAKAAEERAIAEAKARAEAVRVRLVSGGRFEPGEGVLLGIPVRWVPAGRFRMGSSSDEDGRDSDEVQHDVVLSRGFFLAETECTQGQWEAVMGGNPSNFKGVDRPVERVSWEEAVEYCRKLTAQQRTWGILPEGWEWRLPTEAEWEYAARAGTSGARHGELDAIAWYGANSGSQTHPVKQKAADGWGLHDMLGNVWEWCSDWHGEYPTGSVTDPTGPGSGSNRVNRGGGWFNDARYARSAVRDGFDPGFSRNNLGFRPALCSVR